VGASEDRPSSLIKRLSDGTGSPLGEPSLFLSGDALGRLLCFIPALRPLPPPTRPLPAPREPEAQGTGGSCPSILHGESMNFRRAPRHCATAARGGKGGPAGGAEGEICGTRASGTSRRATSVLWEIIRDLLILVSCGITCLHRVLIFFFCFVFSFCFFIFFFIFFVFSASYYIVSRRSRYPYFYNAPPATNSCLHIHAKGIYSAIFLIPLIGSINLPLLHSDFHVFPTIFMLTSLRTYLLLFILLNILLLFSSVIPNLKLSHCIVM
jgi:hypothetical protein